MAEEIVVKEPFTDQMRDSGRSLVRELGELGLDVKVAFWLFRTDVGAWRLIIASPKVDTEGSRASYSTVQTAVEKLGESTGLDLDTISVLGPTDLLVRPFTSVVHESGSTGTRIKRSALSNTYVEDAFVYRVEQDK